MTNQKKQTGYIAVLFVGILFAFFITSCGEEEQKAGAPPEVQVAKAFKMNVPVTGEWVGQT